MKFAFEYDIAGRIETLDLTISDAMLAKALAAGHDLISVEDIAKRALDQFMATIEGGFNRTK